MAIAFSRTSIDDNALEYLRASLAGGKFSGDGPFSQRCHSVLQEHLGSPALLTHSCTAALEMAALLSDIGPGDEVILPSYTFVSTANAFVLRGAIPVFVDIRPDTLNLDEALLASALTRRTKAIVPVHYAGVACEMDAITSLAETHGLMVIEDAAQAYGGTYKGRPLGTIGTLGCFSFHITKNIVSGEGGALVVNDSRMWQRAQIVREKGTNRTQFLRQEVARYEWLDVGSSFLPSDLIAAVLLSQLEKTKDLIDRRVATWYRYHNGLAGLEQKGLLARPTIPAGTCTNGHLYYILLPTPADAHQMRNRLKATGIDCPPHYVPLHSSPAGKRYGRVATDMTVTTQVAETLLRLPLHAELTESEVARVIESVSAALE